MHKQWHALIPYYLNGTLDQGSRIALERHLAICPACRDAVEDWRLVAGAVYEETAALAAQTPPITTSLRAAVHAGPVSSENGHSQATIPVAAVRPDSAPHPAWSVERARAPRRRVRIPLTLAAVFAVVLGFGLLLAYIGARGDEPDDPQQFGLADDDSLLPTFTPSDTPPGEPPGTPEMLAIPAVDGTPTPLPPPTQGSPAAAGAGGDDLGILAIQPPGAATTTPVNPPPESICTATTSDDTRVVVYQFAGTQYGVVDWIGSGVYFQVLTQTRAGDWLEVLNRNTYVRGWVQRPDVILYGPCSSIPQPTPTAQVQITPTAVFHYQIGGGYVLLTTTQIDSLPAETRVRITSATYDGAEWLYTIVSENGVTARARQWQLSVAPIGPTPTSSLNLNGAWGYDWLTTEAVGQIPAFSRVAVGSSWYTGSEWIYSVHTQAGLTGEARATQLQWSPNPDATASPTSYVTPTAVWHYSIGSGFAMVTTEQVGAIASGARVRISSAWYTSGEWVYSIVDENGVSAEARTWQIMRTGTIASPTPTPNITPTAAFYGLIGKDEYRLQLKVQIGTIPAGTFVRVIDMRYDGTDWLYTVVSESGVQGEAYTSQMLYPPPTPSLTPYTEPWLTASPSATYTLMPTPEP